MEELPVGFAASRAAQVEASVAAHGESARKSAAGKMTGVSGKEEWIPADDTVKPGVLARLPSGGPDMTITKSTSAEVTCVWFDAGSMQTASFPTAAILVKKEEPR